MKPAHGLRGVLVALALGGLAAPAWATATLRDALDRAWERATQGRVAEARRGEAEASRIVSEAWFPEAPSIGFTEKTDRFNRNRGERELELALPLWLPGQRAARQILAERQAADGEAAILAARLAIAGELRTAVWAWGTARAELEMSRERLGTAEKLEADVARREQAGDLARIDLLLAREETLAARSAQAEARSRERQAFERYRFLTGLDALPEQIDETVAPSGPDVHPRRRLAETAFERARAEMDVARASRRDAPELSIGLQQARDDFASANNNTVRIGIRIPFATEARNAPLIATANSALIRAEAEARQVLAELDAEHREALAALESANASAEAAQTRAELAMERLRLQERAFALGELALNEFMRVRAAANEARLDALRATHAKSAARARLNQAKGILP
jgi:outer membrane protein TolC